MLSVWQQTWPLLLRLLLRGLLLLLPGMLSVWQQTWPLLPRSSANGRCTGNTSVMAVCWSISAPSTPPPTGAW
jgi:hypothetical protein